MNDKHWSWTVGEQMVVTPPPKVYPNLLLQFRAEYAGSEAFRLRYATGVPLANVAMKERADVVWRQIKTCPEHKHLLAAFVRHYYVLKIGREAAGIIGGAAC